jgi:hypothetical protein
MRDYGTAYSATGTDQTDTDYPGGKGVDASSQTAKDGFPFKSNYVNDFIGAAQALIISAARGRITNRAGLLSEISGDSDDAFTSDIKDFLLSQIDPIDPAIGVYSASSNYTFGDLVRSYGSQYLCLIANGPATTVKNPLEDVNGDYWFELPTEKWLRGMSQVIKPFFLGIKDIFDYNDASYQMVFPFGQYLKGDYIYKYFAVIHDDSNVISSGDAAFNAMAQGSKGGIIASLVGSDYTMIDGKECAISAQGDLRPATFGRQEDAFQGFKTAQQFGTAISGTSNDYVDKDPTGGEQIAASAPTHIASYFGAITDGYRVVTTGDFYTDGSHGTPRIASETRMKNLQGGALAQIVCEIIAA